MPDAGAKHVIVVDLDGTLIRTDLFVEAATIFLRGNPLNFFLLIYWLIRGRPFAKKELSQRITFDFTKLPYRSELLEYLAERKNEGHAVWLATATSESYARGVAEHLKLFDLVISSTDKKNLKGKSKLRELRKHLDGKSFVYVGDSKSDLPIWAAADKALVVGSQSNRLQRLVDSKKVLRVLDEDHSSFVKLFLKQARLHQWAKNALIFVPLLTSHSYVVVEKTYSSFLAFLLFGLCASGVYFLNDLFDLQADRSHPTKANRPLASGRLPPQVAIVGAIALPGLALFLAGISLSFQFLLTLVFYYLVTVIYTLKIKRILIADVMTLAFLFTLRVIAGAAAIDVELSSWLLAFSVFFFVSLAYLKRYIEFTHDGAREDSDVGRGYRTFDSESLFSQGASSGIASIVVLSLFINSDDFQAQYSSPDLLWALCFLLFYWTNRVWTLARRGKIEHDPIAFAIRDRASLVMCACCIVVVLMARFV